MNSFLYILIWVLTQSLSIESIIVQVRNGKIKGKEDTSLEGRTFYSFQGIPFAKPPLNELRFQAPVEADDWEGIRDATRNTTICIQIDDEVKDLESEDCLLLNVYTPKLPNSGQEELLPVMAYIYGGGFYVGNASYERNGPHTFMDFDVVVVTINYRLIAFGFLSTADQEIPGNAGLKDQLLGLHWIQKNIVKFGGDPRKVTIFGNSAGGGSVGFHMLSNKSRGLFRGAIQQSGTPLAPWALQRNPKSVVLRTLANLEVNSSVTDSKEILDILRKKSASDIRTAALKLFLEVEDGMKQDIQGYLYGPVLEKQHANAFLTEPMYEEFLKGNFNKVPVMMGNTNGEGIEYADDMKFYLNKMKYFDDAPENLVPSSFKINDTASRTLVGKIIQRTYGKNGLLSNKIDSLIEFINDAVFVVPSIKQAELQSKFVKTYFYVFSYDGIMGNIPEIIPGIKAVGHTEESNYLWRVDLPGFSNLNTTKFPEKDLVVRKQLLTLWTNFAKYLNPTIKLDDTLNRITWTTAYNQKTTDFTYLDIGNELIIKKNYKRKIYQKWNFLHNRYGQRPFDTY